MQSIQTLNALSQAIAKLPIIYECGCFGTASWFAFKTLMHSCYFCMMHSGVILGLRGSMLNGMTNVDTITSKYFEFGAPNWHPTNFLTRNTCFMYRLTHVHAHRYTRTRMHTHTHTHTHTRAHTHTEAHITAYPAYLATITPSTPQAPLDSLLLCILSGRSFPYKRTTWESTYTVAV